ncbi:MAG: MATE family efflux transporter [Oscillospiraceae bacterium]|nr:MATE family efflux transporter [Oscillospiraceae bacterium]
MNERKENQGGVTVLTEGSPWRLLFLFSLPLMAGNIFQQMYTVVDTAVVGKVLGVDALAALGAVDWLNWLTLGAIQGFTQGFSILMAQRFGAGDYGKLRQTAANSIVLAALCAAVLTTASQALAGTAVDLLQTPGEIRPISIAYLRIIFGGLPIVMAYNLAASILRALGDGRTPLAAMIVASLTNIALDLLFVMGFRWGVQGAAAATLMAQCLAAGYCIWRLSRMEVLRLSREDWVLSAPLCGRLMWLGSPMAFQNTIIAIGGMIIQTIVNGFGVAFIAGYTAANKLYGILEVAATSYGYAMTTYAGQNLGAGKVRRISQGIRAGMVIALATSVVITALMLAFGRLILSFFLPAGAEASAEALGVGYQYLSLMALCLPALYVLHVTRSCIQGLGNTVLPMVSGMSEFVMRTGGALTLPPVIGETGVMIAEVLAWFGADLILAPSYFFVMKRVRREMPEDH